MKPDKTKNEIGLDGRQVRAIELLQAGASFDEVCDQVGISRSTLWRWRQDPIFAAELAANDAQRLEDAKRRLTGLMDDMITILRNIAQDENMSEHARIKAARSVMEWGNRLTEQIDIIERIKAIEEALKERVI